MVNREALGTARTPWNDGAIAVRMALAMLALLPLLACVSLAGCSWGRWKLQQDEQLAIAAREHARRGIEEMQSGDWEKAERSLAQAVAANPQNERARAQYAQALWRRGAGEQAIAELVEAVRLSRGDASLRVQLGEMHLARGEFEAARQQAKSALASDWRHAAAWALLGDVQRRQGRLQEALDDYHQALARQPDFPGVQLQVAEIHRTLGRPQRALSTVHRLAEQYPSGEEPEELVYLEGLCLQALDRHADAANRFAVLAARQGRPSPDLLYALAESQLLAGRPADATLSLREALAAAPDHAGCRALEQRILAARTTAPVYR